MATSINYDDERFTKVESDKQEALTEIEQTYGSMIDESDSFYQAQIDASKEYATQQQQNQQAQTDFAIEQIEQQKEQAQKDYTKEQSASYVDWQKESNKYGANAEQMAASGLQNTGYSESSQVSMYNTYQNRVATARQTYNEAVLNYNNAIKDAQLQNSAALAEIAYNALQNQLQLALEQFQYKNNLVLELANQKQQISSEYYNRWLDVENQINTENALAEEIRQYNEQLALEKEKIAQEQAQWEKEYALEQAQLEEEIRQFNEQLALSKKASASSSGSSSSSSSSGGDTKIAKQSSDSNSSSSGTFSAADLYGVFSNGYQPKGIVGYGLVSKTGQTMTYNGSKRNVWKTPDGTLWYWNGTNYVKYISGGIKVTSLNDKVNYLNSK